jgi:hypothetical protein
MLQNPGIGGDGVSELMVRQAPEYLAVGGCAVSLISWHYRSEEEDWASRPCTWAQGTGCDLWLCRVCQQDPLDYAVNALRQTESMGTPRYAERIEEWMQYFREQGMVHLALGAVILRKRTASRNWVHEEKLSGNPAASDAGEQLERIFAAEDFLDGCDDEKLLESRLLLHPDHVVEQKVTAGTEGWTIQSIQLTTTRGIEYQLGLDGRVFDFLSKCDGQRTLREAISQVAEDAGVSFGAAADVGLPLVRRLLRNGFLVE